MDERPLRPNRLPSLRTPAIGFAHRGASANAQENTLEAFEMALRLGATGLETDAWLTADGEVVLDHDGVLRKGLRRSPIANVERTALPALVPTLSELYERCGSNFELSIDVNDEAAFGPIVDTARAAGVEARLWLCHPSVSVLAEQRAHTTARLVNSTRLKLIKEGPERRAASLAERGIDGCNMHHTDWSGGLTTLFHRFDRYCLAWDTQFERAVVDLVRMGIDGVYGDFVDRLMVGIVEADA
jgi:glycerophosphoryl diester phosphodiesterase